MALAGGDSAALEPLISVNQPGRIFIARLGRSELTDIMTAVPVRELVELMLESSGRAGSNRPNRSSISGCREGSVWPTCDKSRDQATVLAPVGH